MDQGLPSFTHPPLVEVAVSAMFRRLPKLGNAELGLFWLTKRDQYPKTADAEPIPHQAERFENALPRLPGFKIVPASGAARLQMMDADERQMIQVQNGRLAYNWRKMGNGTYPRWDAVYSAFQSVYREFTEFLRNNDIGQPEPNQWEVVYVNHLERGRDWADRTDWHRDLPGLIGTAVQIGGLESAGCNYRFALPDQRGRLHVDMTHGFTPQDPPLEVLTLQMTARGPVNEQWDLASGVNFGRRTIVQTFANITGPDAHTRWGRTQ